jgi:hypothetical protein
MFDDALVLLWENKYAIGGILLALIIFIVLTIIARISG